MPLADLSSTSVQQATQTFSVQLQGSDVAQQVIEELGLAMTPSGLLSHLGVNTRPDSTALHVVYDDVASRRGSRILAQLTTDFVADVQTQQKSLFGQSGPTASPTPKNGKATPLPTSQFLIKVVDPAHPVGKVQPRPVRNVALAGLLGLLLGVVAAFVREQVDDTVRGVEQAEEAFGQEATATLPPGLLGRLATSPPRRRGMDPVLAELAVQRLAANLLWPPQAQGKTRAVVVTSAQPDEGKSTVAANLAVELATSGRRVILVEADLRRPVLHRYLGLDPSSGAPGLDAVIRDRSALDRALVQVGVPASPEPSPRPDPEGGTPLQAILAGPGHAWPPDGERVLQVLEALRGRSDYVIFDAPPTLVVPDAYPLIAAVDVVVAVTRSGESSARATAAFSRRLQRLKARRVELVITEVDEPYQRTSYHAYLSRGRPAEPQAPPAAPLPPGAGEAGSSP
jgi:Mrp family chromosome partitioning ATPase